MGKRILELERSCTIMAKETDSESGVKDASEEHAKAKDKEAKELQEIRQRRSGGGKMFLSKIEDFVLMGGVVFGLSSLYPLLYRQNYLEGLCAGEVEEGQCAERSLTKCCTSQLVRLSLVSSIAFFTVDAVAVLWGEFAVPLAVSDALRPAKNTGQQWATD